MAKGCCGGTCGSDPAAKLARPTVHQAAWQDLEIGVFYHFDLHVVCPDKKTPYTPQDYNPQKLDTDQWLEAAKRMGAKYAVFTAKHGTGFLQWQSDAYPFGCRQAPWRGGKGDVVRDFAESCRRVGIKPGIYCHVMWNPLYQIVNGKVNWGKGDDPVKQAEYKGIAEKMLTELWSNYGEWAELWFDGGALAVEEGGPDVVRLKETLQPQAMVFQSPASTIRWIGNEDGVAGYPCWATVPGVHEIESGAASRQHGDPNGSLWLPGECDVPMPGHYWDWKPDQPDIEPLPKLMEIYYKSVGRNCNLLLNATVNADGLVPERNLKYYENFGKEIRRRFGRAVAETAGTGKGIRLTLPKERKINHVMIMEDIWQGERIRKYAVEGLVGPDDWAVLCEGESVGHKRIQEFESREVAEVRLIVSEAAGEPQVTRLAVFDTAATS